MELQIDTAKQELRVDGKALDYYSKRSFEILSREWLKVGWNERYPYTFSWKGFPIIQIAEDIIRAQEVIWRVKPDVIIETGVAHGGSVVFYSDLCPKVIGVEKDLHCRKQVEALGKAIYLIEGNSTAPEIVEQVESLINPGEKVMVFLDSFHSKEHVLKELYAYSPFVSQDSYIVATDGSMEFLDVPRAISDWTWNNPQQAVREFLKFHTEFFIDEPKWPFNKSDLTENVTHWPNAWLKRK